MTWIIAGGRNYTFSAADVLWLDSWLEMETKRNGEPVILTGGATGADWHGKQWAISRGLTIKEMCADWSRGKRAGPERNMRMAIVSDGLIAFPGGAGTRNMIRTAKECNLNVIMHGGDR